MGVLIDRRIDEIGRVYSIPPGIVYQSLMSGVPGGASANKSLANVYGLLIKNESVREMLALSRNDGHSFAKKERESRSPDYRFQEALDLVIRWVADEFEGVQDFSSIDRFKQLWDQLQSYRSQEPTPHAREMRASIDKLLRDKKVASLFEGEGIAPFIYGSVYYGDAGARSDYDLLFLHAREDVEFGKMTDGMGDLVNTFSEEVDRRCPSGKGVDHFHPREVTFNLLDLSEQVDVIMAKEATRVHDYAYTPVVRKKQVQPGHFAGYNLLVEGEPLGHFSVNKQVRELQRNIVAAANQDPFFDFLLSFKLYGSLEKRKKNSGRRA